MSRRAGLEDCNCGRRGISHGFIRCKQIIFQSQLHECSKPANHMVYSDLCGQHDATHAENCLLAKQSVCVPTNSDQSGHIGWYYHWTTDIWHTGRSIWTKEDVWVRTYHSYCGHSGLALCSKGAQSSVNILAWIISWRLLMGIGIGAGYPLGAVIVSEYVNCKELIHWSCQPYRLLFAHMHIRNPNQLPLFVHCKSLVVGLLDSSCSYLSQLRRAEMAAEQWNEMLLQKLVRTLIWERHGHSNGFQKQEEKETV